jgi:hypothetical protein
MADLQRLPRIRQHERIFAAKEIEEIDGAEAVGQHRQITYCAQQPDGFLTHGHAAVKVAADFRLARRQSNEVRRFELAKLPG